MNRDKFTVGEYSVRPAGKPGECFYCNTQLGEEHKPGCVIRGRTVIVRASIEYVWEAPEDWTPEDIEFHFNASSSCANNIIADICAMRDRIDGCLCGRLEAKYIREATEEDEQRDKLFIEERES